MKSENRHYTKVWKEKRKNKRADLCKCAKCLVCHSAKVMKVPNRQTLIENSKRTQNKLYDCKKISLHKSKTQTNESNTNESFWKEVDSRNFYEI